MWCRAGSAAGAALLPRRGLGGLGQAGEQLAQRQAEAGQDVAAGQGVGLGERRGLIGGGVDDHGPLGRVHQPDEADAGQEVFAELAPHFLHVNNSYGEWFAEDQALGIAGMKPKTLEEYKASGELQILTPEAAIAYFKDLQARMPIEHFMMGMPAGLPPERFLHYAGQFAQDVLPAFA